MIIWEIRIMSAAIPRVVLISALIGLRYVCQVAGEKARIQSSPRLYRLAPRI
jgi:hypothetical protein